MLKTGVQKFIAYCSYQLYKNIMFVLFLFQTRDQLTTGMGAPIASKTAVITAGERGPMLIQVQTVCLAKELCRNNFSLCC